MILKLYPYPCVLTLKIVKSLSENVGGLVEYDKGYITMKLKLDDCEKYYIHESMHVVQAVEKYIEQKLGEEEEAYLIQYITDNIKQYITKNARKYVISDRKKKNGRRKNKTTKDLQQKGSITISRKKIHKRKSKK